jgi:hypothetical protein
MSDGIIPTILSPTEAAGALGIEVLDLALNLRRAAAEMFATIGGEVARGHPLDEDTLQRARNLVAAAEACDEVWEQDNPPTDDDA